MIQAYVDDSGTRRVHPVFVMAGFIGEAEQWASLSNSWRDQLQAPPSIRYLKMAEAAKLKGQFKNWKSCERDDKLKGFVETIKACPPAKAIHATVDLNAYEKHMAPHLLRPISDPFFMGCYIILSGVGHEVIDSFPPQGMEMFFDEHVMIGPRVRMWYPLIKAAFKGRTDYETGKLHDVLPSEPMFRNDEEYPPLQAADMIAWLFRMASSGQRNEFEWIGGELSQLIPMSEYSSSFTSERMQSIQAKSLEMIFPIELIRSWEKQLGIRSPRPRHKRLQ